MADNSPTKKSKKPPACDYCKAKRVICHPQQSGSCPRCLERGITCKTTPVVRRRRRTKAEVQEQARTSGVSGSFSSVEPSESVEDSDPQIKKDKISNLLGIWRGSTLQYSSSSVFVNLAPPSLDITQSLVQDLFQDLRALPQYYYPLLPLSDLEVSLKNCSWNLHALPPQDRVLAQCIVATSARISTHPLLVDHDDRDFPKLAKCAPLITRQCLDLREFGQRREHACQQLKAEATWLAQREGVTYNICISNAVSIAFLEFLEYRASGKGGNAYSVAYIHHLRELSEDDFDNVQIPARTPTVYSSYLMSLAVCAASTGKSVPFTYNDELLLCGEDETTLEQILNTFSPESVVATPIFNVMRPMCLNTIHLSREISETLTGVYARRHPLNETRLTYILHRLDLLHSTIVGGLGQMQRLRPTVDDDMFQNMRYCAHPLIHGWCTLVLVAFEEVKERRKLIRLTEVDFNMASSETPSHLDSLYLQTRSMASLAALELAISLEEVPALSRLTHTNYGDLKKWPRFLLDEGDASDLTTAQRIWALERLRDALSLAGFSWVDQTGTVEAIDEFLASCAIQEITDSTSSIVWQSASVATESERLIADWLRINTFSCSDLIYY